MSMEKVRDLRKKEQFIIDDVYLNGYARICGINATGVYLSLCRHANKIQQCFPSKSTIADELAISERSVFTALKVLEAVRIIKIESQGRTTGGIYKSNIYTLLDKSEWLDVPQATGAVGKICTPPQANNDNHRRQEVPNKELNTKDAHSKVGTAFLVVDENQKKLKTTPEMQEVFDLFTHNPARLVWKTRSYIREAAQVLYDTFGIDELQTRYDISQKHRGEDLCPQIDDPSEFLEKMPKMENFLKKL